jgi:hypothetical protein
LVAAGDLFFLEHSAEEQVAWDYCALVYRTPLVVVLDATCLDMNSTWRAGLEITSKAVISGIWLTRLKKRELK